MLFDRSKRGTSLGFATPSRLHDPESERTRPNSLPSAADTWGSLHQQAIASTFGIGRSLGPTTLCGSSADCGAGFYCNQGKCVESGGGNTHSGPTTGCSVGPDENGSVVGHKTCGSRSGSANLGGCFSPGCGFGSTTQSCSGNGGPTGTRCCRYGVGGGGYIGCWDGKCQEPPGCSSYCTGQYASYGTMEGGCDSNNTCDECASCIDGQCVAKDRDQSDCHCDPKPDDACDRPETPLTCCNYMDTCMGRVPGLYCHETYRTGYPRCYNPDIECPPAGCTSSYECGECSVCSGGTCVPDSDCDDDSPACGDNPPRPPLYQGSTDRMQYPPDPCWNWQFVAVTTSVGGTWRCWDLGLQVPMDEPPNWYTSSITENILFTVDPSLYYVDIVGDTGYSYEKACEESGTNYGTNCTVYLKEASTGNTVDSKVVLLETGSEGISVYNITIGVSFFWRPSSPVPGRKLPNSGGL